ITETPIFINNIIEDYNEDEENNKQKDGKKSTDFKPEFQNITLENINEKPVFEDEVSPEDDAVQFLHRDEEGEFRAFLKGEKKPEDLEKEIMDIDWSNVPRPRQEIVPTKSIVLE